MERRNVLLGGIAALLATTLAANASSLITAAPNPVFITIEATTGDGKSMPVNVRIDTQRKINHIEFAEALPPDCFIWQNKQGEIFVMRVSASLAA